MLLETWTQENASKELLKRWQDSKRYRHQFESDWDKNEATLFATERVEGGYTLADDVTGLSMMGGGESTGSSIKINYAMKYVRFIHAQMSANPPSAIPKPTSDDKSDRYSSTVADHLIQHGIREYGVQEEYDQTALDALVYGTGWMRCWFNPLLGPVYDVNEETKEVLMSGDNEIKKLPIRDVWIDPSAKRWKDVRYVFIRHTMSVEQACYMWPQHKDQLIARRQQRDNDNFFSPTLDSNEGIQPDDVEVLEYIEKGLPWNGNVGRYVWMLDSGLLLSKLGKSPFPNAQLPISPLTDIDVPGQVYGKAVTSYLARMQEVLEAIDSTELDNIAAHGVVRLVLPDGAEIEDDGISNNGWEYIKVSGNAGNGPYFMNPPSFMPDIHRFRDQLLAGMEALSGVPEAAMGQQSREMSGFSMQTAINAGNMIRRRLFNKATNLVKWMWTTYLEEVKAHWSDGRKVLVTGTEDALSVAFYSQADLAGGFTLQVDYGQSFSLDPASRREEILQISPMLKEAGMSMAEILDKIKLNDTKGLVDMATLAKRRQEEIFEDMISKYEAGADSYIAPREMQDHKSMLEAAYKYIMSKRFDNLPEDLKRLIEQHVKAREGMAASTAAAQAPAAPGPMPAPGAMPPMPAM
jgi:hypothetical protein